MSLTEFLADPWRKGHRAYDDSAISVPAPEYASSEVVVSSVYRAVGVPGLAESKVPTSGREFDRLIRQPNSSRRAGSAISPDTWQTVLQGTLESPRLPNQSSRRLLQMSPIVPDVAMYSGSARPRGNSWNPGSLVKGVIRLGSTKQGAAELVWKKLFEALTVGEADDIWARWLQGEFEKRRQSDLKWEYQPLEDGPDLPFSDKEKIDFPGRQFVRDLEAIIGAKEYMTRRQWISLLEAVLRIGCVTHVLWLCDLSARLWSIAKDVLGGQPAPTEDALRAQLFDQRTAYLAYGNPSLRVVRDYASGYLVARLGINLLAWHLEDAGKEVPQLTSIVALRTFLATLQESRPVLAESKWREQLSQLFDEQARTLACKKGIGSNMMEFARHVLGQRQTANDSLRGYDQGYFLRKKGQHKTAPWVVSMGPVAVLALVHCCLKEVAGPRSVDRLCQHLSRYRLGVDIDDIAESDLGQKLRMLGLVLDSPDAESGMLLMPPFEVGQRARGDAA